MSTTVIRTFQPDDLPALVDAINHSADHDETDARTTLDELRARFEWPYFYPEQNCLVALLPDGALAGYTTAELDPRIGRGWGRGCVDPAYRRRGIGRALIRAADARHLDRSKTEMAPDLPLSVTRHCRDTNSSLRALLESEGYAIARVSWIMRTELGDPVEVPPLPDGIALRPFERERDANAVWQAEQEFFRDHWGYVAAPFDLWQNFMFPPTHTNALWILAVDGDAIIGTCLAQPKHDDPATGWIDTVGVHEAYRRRGLGSALLRRGLAALQAHGFAAAELEVDSENTTNAVALYERAGMKIKRRYLIYQKTLRDAGPIVP